MLYARNFFVFIVFVILISGVSALSQINIYIDESGNALFLGKTSDEPALPENVENKDGEISGATSSLTNKRGKTWEFSYFLEDGEFNIILPEGAVIKNINNGDISLDGSRLSIFVKEGAKLSYYVENSRSINNFYALIIAVILIAAVIVILAIYLIKNNKKSRRENAKKGKQKRIDLFQELLNEREKIILEKLKQTGKIKSSQLRKICNIPKASFSRHVQELEKKNLIKRTGDGKNKFVELI